METGRVHNSKLRPDRKAIERACSLGLKRKGPNTYRLRWDDVAYQPGELRVVAYQHGKYWAESRVCTAGPVARVSLLPERDSVALAGSDFLYVTLVLSD